MEASEDRSALHGSEERLFKLVSKKATSAQWAEWLRAPLEHALAEGETDLASSLLKAGANGGAGWKGCDGRTLLDAAAEGGSEDMVSALLDAGARNDVDARSGPKQMTALHRASKGGHTAVAQALLMEGADAGLVDSDRRSALHHALQNGHGELAKRLVAGADLNAKDIDGNTPLHFAATRDLSKLVGTLVRRGVGVDVANNKGQCPLHLAVRKGRITVAEALLKAGADPNLRYDGEGVHGKYSPLVLASRDAQMTKMLIKHGVDAKGVDGVGFTALHWTTGNPGVIDALLEDGADLEARALYLHFSGRSFSGWTPFCFAAALNNLKGMAALLRKGANINAQDDDGLTPMHLVCVTETNAKSAYKRTDFLLRRGADETIRDDDGHTPKDLIENSAATGSLRKLLEKAPADRTWRRRGMLVVCRARSAKVLGGGADAKAGKILRQGEGIGAGAAAAAGRGDEAGCLLARVVELEAEEVFRAIVGFL